MSSAEVVPINGEQMILNGFPIQAGKTRFSLTNDKRQVTDKELAYNDFVEGTFSARVKGVQMVEVSGELVGVFILEVLKAEIA